jgi:hypothetical protein
MEGYENSQNKFFFRKKKNYKDLGVGKELMKFTKIPMLEYIYIYIYIYMVILNFFVRI